MHCTLIIPVYNEALVVGKTLETLSRAFDIGFLSKGHEWSILVVDNGSSDGTADLVRKMAHPRVRVLELTEKGKGRAVRAGLAAAAEGIVGYTDVDLAVSPENIIDAFHTVMTGETDVVIGSRFHPDTVMPGREWWRTLNSRIFNLFARTIIGVKRSDTQCPLKVMDQRGKAVLMATSDMTWFFDLEFLALVQRLALRVTEVPVFWNEHVYPDRKSKLHAVRDGTQAIIVMFHMRRTLPRTVEFLRKHAMMTTSPMKWIIVGLGNPGGAYAHTRHNAGRIVLEEFRTQHDLSEWEYKKTYDATVSKGSIAGKEVLLLLPETFMNASGKSLATLVKDPDQAAQLVVIHDDVDLPLGAWRFAFDRGSGGQKGVESIITTLKTRAFVRVRIGIAPTLEGDMKREKAGDMVLEKFRPEELERIKNIGKGKPLSDALTTLLSEGLELSRSKWQKWKEDAVAGEVA